MTVHFNKDSTFENVFGDYSNAYSTREKKKRWDDYKKAIGKSKSEFWKDATACEDCIHFSIEESWCNEFNLPCTINPVFGFKMIGMACGGAHYEKRQKELQLFDSV